MSLKEIKCDDVDWIHLALYRNQWQTLGAVVMNCQFMIEGGYLD
jgi:hypothetical protein